MRAEHEMAIISPSPLPRWRIETSAVMISSVTRVGCTMGNNTSFSSSLRTWKSLEVCGLMEECDRARVSHELVMMSSRTSRSRRWDLVDSDEGSWKLNARQANNQKADSGTDSRAEFICNDSIRESDAWLERKITRHFYISFFLFIYWKKKGEKKNIHKKSMLHTGVNTGYTVR